MRKSLSELEIDDLFADDNYLWRVTDPNGGVDDPTEVGESVELPGVILAQRIAQRYGDDGCFRAIDNLPEEEHYNSEHRVELIEGLWRIRQ